MIGLLDPALFHPRSHVEIQQDFDNLNKACRQHGIVVPVIEEYWNELWTQFGAPLERQTSCPSAKRAIQETRKASERARIVIPRLSHNAGRVWMLGFQQLFGQPPFNNNWKRRMAETTIRALATGEDVVLFTRRVLGRNLNIHTSGNSVLEENTRWVLHVQPTGIGHKQVLCIYHPRNLTDRWTSRFDWRLPGNGSGVPHPFVPPAAWWKGSTVAFRTISSKHAWVDCAGNGWARPNIPNGAGYHWDVYLNSTTSRVNQINVVEYGAPSTEGMPGHIHH